MRGSVLAVVLNWNRPDYTIECVNHLRRQSGAGLSILIVDNGSTDGSAERLERLSGPSCRITALEANRGFAEGMNTGLRDAVAGGFDYVWLVNNDAFPEENCLRRLLERMQQDPQLAMVSPRLLSPDGTEQHGGGTVDWSTGELRRLTVAELTGPCRDGHWLTGTAPLIRTAAVARSGFFEPAFFAYWEDVDLSVRIMRAGGRLAAVPEAVAVHLENASSGSDSPLIQFLRTRNAWLFLERNAPHTGAWARWLRFVAASTERAALYQLEGRTAFVEATLAGISAARLRRFGRPDMAMTPANLERWTFRAPWRWSGFLKRAADWIDPGPDATLQPVSFDR